MSRAFCLSSVTEFCLYNQQLSLLLCLVKTEPTTISAAEFPEYKPMFRFFYLSLDWSKQKVDFEIFSSQSQFEICCMDSHIQESYFLIPANFQCSNVKTWDCISSEKITMTAYIEPKMSKLENALRFPTKVLNCNLHLLR